MIERINITSGYAVKCDCCQTVIAEAEDFADAVNAARRAEGYRDDGANWFCFDCVQTGKAVRGEESAR